MKKGGLKSAAMISKEDSKAIPKGATVTRKEVRITVEEIENGFILSKTIDASYKLNGQNEYLYTTKKYFTKDNPLDDALEDLGEKSLADNFD